MSKEALAKVVQRAIGDAAFRRQLSTDPSGALRGFDLTSDEATAIRSGDAGRLSAMGVDQRMSKAFTLGGGASSPSYVGGTDVGTYGSAITTGDPGSVGGDTVSNALVSGNTTDSDALIGGGGAQAGSDLTAGGDSVYGNTLTAGNDAMGTVIPSDPALASDAFTNDPAHAFGAISGNGDPMFGNTLTAGTEDATNALLNDGGASGTALPSDAGSGPDISQ